MKKIILFITMFLISITSLKAVTREDLQDMVVSTALSYLHNNVYTDYDQYAMDSNTKITYTNGKTTTNNSFNWRNTKISPEEISRTNIFSIDCSSFASIVYKYSLGYDFSEHYAVHKGLTYYTFDTKTSSFKRNEVSSPQTLLTRINQFGRGMNGRYYIAASALEYGVSSTKSSTSTSSNVQDIILENVQSGKYYTDSTNKKMGVFIYKPKNTSNSKQTAEITDAIAKMEEILQPGDIINYTRVNSEGKTTGHTMIYVGDIMGKRGIIHSTGSDYYTSSGELNKLSSSDDYYSVRFDTMDYLYEGRLKKQNVTFLSIVRPINKYCSSSTCATDSQLSSNISARRNLKWLRVEQYARTTKSSIDTSNLDKQSTESKLNISKYNSVNIGDEIEYTLYLHNRSYRSYCTGISAGGYYTESTCTATSNRKWEKLGNKVSYSNYTVTAYIPDNTAFVKCNYNCTQDGNKITWKPTTLDNGEYISIRYTVKVKGGTTITNQGMNLKYKNSTLTMGKLTTNVSPTNNKINAEQIRTAIKEFKTAISKANPGITYGSSVTTYKVKPSEAKNTVFSSYGFIKNIYYNAFGIELDELSGSNIKNAIFNKDKNYDSYAKKTEKEISSLTNKNYTKINQMLVKGFYGGRNLKGNDNLDRTGRLRLSDLEIGDIIVIFSTSDGKVAGTSTLYMYLGHTKLDGDLSAAENDKKGSFVRFSSGNKLTLYTETTSTTAYQFFNELWSKQLFVVLRPSQLYGTNVSYSGGTISGKNSVVEYNTYKTLKDLTSTKEYTVTFNYGERKNDNWTKTYTGKNTFCGWYSDSKYTNEIKNGNKLSSTSNHTIYAKWNNYVKLPSASVTGYTVKSWHTNSSLSDTGKVPGTDYKLSKNQTLYAKWVANTYTVKFNANGGTGTMSNQSHTYDSTEELTLNKFTKSGYVFDGWSKTASGQVAYEDGASVKNLTSTNNGTVTLYAKWRVKEQDEFEVSLTLKNATSDATKKIIKKGSTATFTITPKTGYTNCKTNIDTLKITDNKLTITNVTKNTSVTVTCSGIKYSVIYNPNGGEGTMENSSHTYGTAKELNPNKYYKNGYSFRGWSKTINGTIEFKDEENVVNLTTSSKYNLYAVWSPKTYKITYELNGGTLDNKITTYKITSDDIKLNIPKKEGYTFKGWTTDDNKTPQKEVIIPKGSTGNKTYAANYETGKYKITYKSDKYGTITGITEETLNYKSSPSGTTKTIKEGYKNLKWSVNKDVTLKNNTTILEGSPITESQIKEIVVKEDLVITAYHYAKKYKVSYSNSEQGKIKGITNEDVSHNSNPLGTKTTPNKGYKFKYWVANKDVKLKDGKTIQKGKQIKDIKSIVVSENITLTPVFEKGTFKISYQSDDYGIINGNEIQNITYPNTLPLTQTSSLDENYEFQYWTANTDVSLSDDTEIKIGYPISNDELVKIIATNDMVLTANYSQQLFNVYYLNYEDIVVTENSKEIVSKTDFLTGPELDRNRWDKEIVYTSDKNVTLSSGETIKAGKAITEEQLKQINVTEDLNITPRYENDLKLINFDKLNLDLILTIIFIVIAIPVVIYIIKSMKKNRMN